MGTYYCAVNDETMERFESPEGFSIKSPGIFHPGNPFAGMYTMMNTHQGGFVIVNDGGWDSRTYSNEYKDITEKVYKEYLSYDWSD